MRNASAPMSLQLAFLFALFHVLFVSAAALFFPLQLPHPRPAGFAAYRLLIPPLLLLLLPLLLSYAKAT